MDALSLIRTPPAAAFLLVGLQYAIEFAPEDAKPELRELKAAVEAELKKHVALPIVP